VKTSSTQQSLATPQKCADFLTASFDKVTEVLSDHPLIVKQEAHFRLQSARRGEAAVADRAESVRSDTAKTEKQSVKFAEVSPETKKSLRRGHAQRIWAASSEPSGRTVVLTLVISGRIAPSLTSRSPERARKG
jgi:hypothetical protein